MSDGTLTGGAVELPIDGAFAREPYGVDTILADLLIDPAACSVLERFAPGLNQVPAGLGVASLPPGMATILTPRLLLQFRPDVSLDALQAALAAVPLTPDAMRARCARYDRVPPPLPAALPRPALLVFDKCTGFRDTPSVEAATAMLGETAARRGWACVFSDKGAVFNPRDLTRFDAVVWNNVSGDALTIDQRRAFVAWIEAGGGFVGIHGAAGDPVCPWDWYADTLIGARFAGHPMPPKNFQPGRVVIEPGHAIVDGLPADWTMTEEWYSFRASPRLNGARVLATLDEHSYEPTGMFGKDLRMGDHPLAWVRTVGAGRAFYTAIGHRPENYRHPHAVQLLEQGIAWALSA